LIATIAAELVVHGSTAWAQARMMRTNPRMERMLEEEQQLQQQQGRSQPVDPNAPSPPETDGLSPWLRRFHQSVPQAAEDFGSLDLTGLSQAADAIEQWVHLWGRVAAGQPPQEQINILGRLLDAKEFIDRELDDLLTVRVRFASLPDDSQRHTSLRNYLSTTAKLVDLSGRLQSDLIDILDDTADRFADVPPLRQRLLDFLSQRKSSVGAEVMSVDLIDPPATSSDPNNSEATSAKNQASAMAGMTPFQRRLAMRAALSAGANEANGSKGASSAMTSNLFNFNPATASVLSPEQKLKVIQLMAAAGTIDSVRDLADFIRDETTPPTLILAAAEAIRALGLPQDPRPGQDSTLPPPVITAAKLRERLLKIDRTQWRPEEQRRVETLLAWLADRERNGLEGNVYRLGHFEVRPGDWLLMRNPSPYNLFTDLSPGLFTHVGVLAVDTGSDGKQRMVVVDLEERGTSIPATNVDLFLNRTLNYVFLRHPDPAVAEKMGRAATAMIGDPAEFDLNFRTDRIAQLKNVDLRGKKIHTYCAGLLLLCAQQTGLPREVFFPITETAASGHTQENIATLGLSLGDGFVSPTGALFSPKMEIVGRAEPMYDPQRQVQEAIYDHFAQLMEKQVLRPTPDLFQALRLKVAEAAKDNELLAKALAASANVSAQMDLVSAAKTQAVVETLDDVANGAGREFQAALDAISDGPPPPLDVNPASPVNPPVADQRQHISEERAAIDRIRTKHADLVARWDQRQISLRSLRNELLNYYIQQGCQQLDERFSGGGK
jgi:hypothetical protein